MSSEGASRMSSVLGLKVEAQHADGLALHVAAASR
jgi:hypothetical protein